MDDTCASSSFWKSSHNAFPVDLSDDDEAGPTPAPAKAEAAKLAAPTACEETQYAINARGGGYNGGLVDMKDTEYSSSSFWQKTHNWPVDLSDEDI